MENGCKALHIGEVFVSQVGLLREHFHQHAKDKEGFSDCFHLE